MRVIENVLKHNAALAWQHLTTFY